LEEETRQREADAKSLKEKKFKEIRERLEAKTKAAEEKTKKSKEYRKRIEAETRVVEKILDARISEEERKQNAAKTFQRTIHKCRDMSKNILISTLAFSIFGTLAISMAIGLTAIGSRIACKIRFCHTPGILHLGIVIGSV